MSSLNDFDVLSRLDRLLGPTLDIGAQSGFRPLERGAERYGAYEWWLALTESTVTRFILLSITPRGGPALRANFDVDVWVGVDDGRRYTRRLERHATRATLDEAGTVPPEWIRQAITRVSTIDVGTLEEWRPTVDARRDDLQTTRAPSDGLALGLAQDEDELSKYADALRQGELSQNSVDSYLGHVDRFLRWRRGEYRPGSKASRHPNR